MLFVVFIVLLILETALCNDLANKYIENLLNTTYVTEIKDMKLDPAALPDFNTEFVDYVRFIGNVSGTGNYTNGTMTGLLDAERYSECELYPAEEKGSRAINCTISFGEVRITYNCKMKYGKMPKVNVNAKFKIDDMHANVEIVQNTPMLPVVKTFAFNPLGSMKMAFSGLGPFNSFTNALKHKFKNHIVVRVYNSMNLKLQYVINKAVAQNSLPAIEND